MDRNVLCIASTIVMLFLLSGCGTNSNSASTSGESTTPISLEQIAKNAVHDAVPTSQLTKTGQSFLSFDDSNGTLVIGAELGSQLMQKTETLMDTATVIHDIYKDPRVQNVKLTWYTSGQDAYGNTVADVVAVVDISRSTESKIQWNAFDNSNIPVIADTFEWGPNFQ